MCRRLTTVILWGLPVLVLFPGLALGRPPGLGIDMKADARALARRIDELIDKRLAAAGIKPAAPADDAEFFRRLSLDLNGHIPDLLDIRDFIDDDRPDKRAIWIERTLDYQDADGKSHFAQHFAHQMRSWMLSGSSNNFQVQALQPFFEAWLQQRIRAGDGYHKIVRQILTSQPFAQGGPSPSAFYLDNENKPENLAGTTSRIFLGVKLECAQCHKHPFASWTKNQFWEYAAFFSTFQNFQPQRPGLVRVNLNAGQIKIPGTDKVAKAKFLGGKEAQIQGDPRTALAEWMTAPDNPYFARAAVDHVWVTFFGSSLLEPITEPQDGGPPAHPELLDLLAREFRDHLYDVKFLVRALVSTRAYQRTSRSLTGNKQELYYFARMPVRALSPEQLFDSVARATEYTEPAGMVAQQPFFNGPQTPRREFLAKFAGQDRRAEATTSILQALFLMNGKFLAERTRFENNKSLQTLAASTRGGSAGRLETLYLMVLGRPPRPDESARLVRYLDSGGPSRNPGHALADVFWALLNSGEFSLNH